MQIVSVPPVAKRPEPVPPTYDEVPDVDIAMAVPRDRVNIMKPLGEGAFGRVLLGRVRSIIRRGVVTDVAIKTLKGKVHFLKNASLNILIGLEKIFVQNYPEEYWTNV